MPYLKFNTGVCKIYNTSSTLLVIYGGGKRWVWKPSHTVAFSKAIRACYSRSRPLFVYFILLLNVCESECMCVWDCVSASPLRIYYLLYRKLPTVFVKGYHLLHVSLPGEGGIYRLTLRTQIKRSEIIVISCTFLFFLQ